MRYADVEGIGVLEFPDDTPDEVIRRVVKKKTTERANKEENARIQQEVIDDSNSFLVGIGRGFHDVGQGVKQLYLQAKDSMREKTLSDLIVNRSEAGEYTRKVQGELELYNKIADANPLSAGAGRILGNVAATPVPGGVGVTAATRVGTAAAAGAGTAGVMFTPEGQSRAKNMAIGALAGAGAQAVLGEPLRALGRGATSTASEAAERAEIVAAGKRNKVPVYAPDVTSNPLAREASVLAEKGGPLGTAGGRLRQADAAKEAAQNTLARLKGNYQLGDLGDEVRASLQDRFAHFQKVKTAKYATAARAADNTGPIPTPKLDQTIQQAMRDIQSAGIANPELLARLEAIKNAPRGVFSVVNQLDDDIGDEVSKFYTGENAAVGRKGVQFFEAARKSLKADIENHLQGTAGLRLWKQADEYYQANILPFKKTQLARFVSDKSEFNPEQAWKFIERNAGNPTMMGALYNSLTPNGRVAVKAGLMREAIDAGMVVPQQGGSKVFSPGRVASYLEDKLDLTDRFLKPDEALEFRGMVKLFRAIQRSGQVAENPPTGARLVLPALLASSFWNPKAAAIVGGGLLVSKGIFTSEFMRKRLVQLAELPLNHPKTMRLVSEISAALRQRIPGPLVQPDIQEEE